MRPYYVSRRTNYEVHDHTGPCRQSFAVSVDDGGGGNDDDDDDHAIMRQKLYGPEWSIRRMVMVMSWAQSPPLSYQSLDLFSGTVVWIELRDHPGSHG